jgi:hypothetical protein
MKKVSCDSTLATLVLVAEHHYDYLSGNKMGEMGKDALKIDYGQFQPLIDSIVGEMTKMSNMTEDQKMKMQAHDDKVKELMDMNMQQLMDAGMQSLMMDTVDVSGMMALKPGDVAGEDPTCASVRADVEHFLLVNTLADMSTSQESK